MRNLHIDSLKGFLIICVILGHIVVLTTSLTSINSTAWTQVYSYLSIILPVGYFHMPMFFALSILFVKPITKNFISKRVLQILVPYLAWYSYAHPALLFHLKDTLQNLGYGNWSHLQSILWFLPALFSVNIIYGLYQRYAKYGYIFFIAWLFIFLITENIAASYHVVIPFGIDLAIYLLPYFFIMNFLYQKKSFFTSLNTWHSISLLLIALGCVWLITHFEPIKTYTAFAARIDLAQFTVPFTLIGYIAMTILSAAILGFFLLVPASTTLATIGKYSLPIYLLHLMIMQKITILYNSFTIHNSLLGLIMVIVAFPTIIVIAIGISKLLMSISGHFKYIGMVK